jgi:hypothetical protein
MANLQFRKLLFGALGWILLSGLVVSCSKKNDPSAANAGGGATSPRVVLTLQGAPR